MKKKEMIELSFNFDFGLKRLRIRIPSKLFFVDDEPRMKFVFSTHYLFFFIIFFENVNVITRIFLIESMNNKDEMFKIFGARE